MTNKKFKQSLRKEKPQAASSKNDPTKVMTKSLLTVSDACSKIKERIWF